ncbi:ABC transporter ATP-binding protein [Aeromicrobium yanjiei]|uniref:ATP-binding cassette domain-containing protein n=1 Tax=Aeromicrobium yanjiei TaxID=2662028 RepID=A0A5Q2MG66_9ACTN|nr:ABC transporter ATP-binding protein [Aeromicrobium yanjiei]QGG40046.1 ATP-binding cassette domain-containing protein [Aeromicrobium yanjiei]
MDVTISNLSLSYGDFRAVKNLSLDIADGESIVMLGQSGCGKTSTMRCIAGLEDPSGGSISIGGRTVFDAESRTRVPANKRNVGLVFQSYAVWPHLTVLENVAFPLKQQKLGKDEIRRKALETLRIVGLEAVAENGASALSGGQMQRVALARSLAMEPAVMLLDEPLSNLDARLRDDLRVELRRLQIELGLTSVYVTHDQGEALALADRIAVMQHGRITQLASPTEIYERPASATIAAFLGVLNIFPVGRPKGHHVDSVDHDMQFVTETAVDHDVLSSVSIRPEHVRVSTERDDHGVSGGVNTWEGRVEVTVFQGATTRCAVRLDAGPVLETTVPGSAINVFHPGDRVFVHVDARDVKVLPNEVPELASGFPTKWTDSAPLAASGAAQGGE